MLTGTGQPSPPWNAMSSTRLTLKVKVLITANPSMFGATTRAKPNGRLRTIAAITAVNRSARRVLLSACNDPATGMRLSLAVPGGRQQTSSRRAAARQASERRRPIRPPADSQ